MIEQIREYAKGGYDHVYLHQVGPAQEGFLDFAAREILPAFQRAAIRAGARARGARPGTSRRRAARGSTPKVAASASPSASRGTGRD